MVQTVAEPLQRALTAHSALLANVRADPALLDRVVQAPVGPVQGRVALHLRITELLVHGWDLAHATGQPARLPQDLAEDEIAFTRGMFAGGLPRAGRFGAAQQIAGSAPALDRLAAELGRTVPPAPPGDVS